MVVRIGPELLDHLEEAARGTNVAHVLQDVGFRADQFIRLGQVGAATVAQDQFRDVAGQCVAGDTREDIRAATLQRNLEMACGCARSVDGIDLRQPTFDPPGCGV